MEIEIDYTQYADKWFPDCLIELLYILHSLYAQSLLLFRKLSKFIASLTDWLTDAELVAIDQFQQSSSAIPLLLIFHSTR